MKIFKQKKAELTTQQIVGLIILITSFAVILFFFFRLNLGEETQKEICHNSVVLKGKQSTFSEVINEVSLDCRTNYLCISGGGECEGINPTQTIKVNSNDKEAIMKIIADEMADCWWMFGEGDVNYGDGTSSEVYCTLCSILKFDNKIQEEFKEISYTDLHDYLIKLQKSSSQTYLQYLYEVNRIDLLGKSNLFKDEQNININEAKILTNEKYSVITGIDNNLGTDETNKDEILKTYLINSKEISSRTQCDKFITKA
tara:strand:+ start:546 stop:1316 length:771 start_codon:yes stop_codon:yes gene_type:complete